MSHVLALLNEMRGRLGMYIGSTSLTKLAAFLRGYDYAILKLRPAENDRFLEQFRDWIHRRFQTNRQSWEEVILLHSTDETEAVKRFWQLLDEYLREHQTATSAASTTGSDRSVANGVPSATLGSQGSD